MERGAPIADLVQKDGVLLESIMATGWDDDSGLPPLDASDPYVACHRHWGHTTLNETWEEVTEEVKTLPGHLL